MLQHFFSRAGKTPDQVTSPEVLSWAHGILAGTDTDALVPLYVVTGLAIVAAAAYRYWVGKRQRPTFSTSLPELANQPADSVGSPRRLAGVALEERPS